MKEIKIEDIEIGEYYLVFTGYKWSPSGYDIGEVYRDRSLISQSNSDNLLNNPQVPNPIIYELPIN